MKFEKKQVYYVVFAFVPCYTIQAYWSSGASIVGTIYKANFPSSIGAGTAYIVSTIMSPCEMFYTRVVKNKVLLKAERAISMILAYLTSILLISWFFSIALPDLISNINSLLKIDTTGVTNFIKEVSDNKAIKELLDYFGNSSDVTSTLPDYSQQILNQVLFVLTGVLMSASTIASAVLNVFVSLVFSIYVLASKEQLGRQLNLLVDTYLGKYAEKTHYVLDILHQRFHGFFVGQTLEAMILGSLTAAGMLLSSLPYAATTGTLVAFMVLIPVIGAYIGATIGSILIAIQPVSQAFSLLVYLTVLQQFEGDVIYLRAVGGSIGLSGMRVLVAVTIGGALWDILGMLAAVPSAASLYQIIKDNVVRRQQVSLDN